MSAAAQPTLALETLRRAKLIVLAGSGGVGKTTSSAALALQAALLGRRVLVLTIDPAQRLLQALGLQGEDPANKPVANVPHEVLPRLQHLVPGGQPGGSLHAMMLDAGLGAIAMVERLLPDAQLRDRVLNNRIYKAFLPTLQASPDYMALELLFELSLDPRFDLVVLDTPPMHNALDFLKAGHTLASFINERVLKWFAKVPLPGKKASGLSSLFGSGSSMAMSVLGRMFGADALPDIAEFFSSFQEVLPKLKDRALATDAMLREPSTQFLVVTAPGETSLREARHLFLQLQQHGIQPGGFIVNRMLQVPVELGDRPGQASLTERLLQSGMDAKRAAALAESLHQAAERLLHLGRSDLEHLRQLQRMVGPKGFCAPVPQREGDVHSLVQLRKLGQIVVDGAAPGLAT